MLAVLITDATMVLAQVLWDSLSELNDALSSELLELNELYREDSKAYADAIKRLSMLRSSQVRETCFCTFI